MAVVAAALVFWPLEGESPERLKWDLATRLAEAWLQKGRPDLALPRFDEAVRLDAGGALPGSESRTGRTARALVYENRALALWQLGRMDEAARSLEQGIALDPQGSFATEKLFELNVLRGRLDEAKEALARAGLGRPDGARILLERARQEQDPARLLAYLRGVTALDSTSEVGWSALVRELVELRRGAEARVALDEAERAGIDPYLVDVHRALIEAREGRMDAARAWLAKVPADRLKTDPRLARTVDLLQANPSGK
jgi:tetratricopeptide (TPR) repeat protein